MRSCAGGDRSRRAPTPRLANRMPFAPDEGPVLTDEQVEMLPFFVGKLEKDALAFRFLEPLPVFLEEAVRRALAADPDLKRLAIGRAFLLHGVGASFEQPVGRAFEEEKGRL